MKEKINKRKENHKYESEDNAASAIFGNRAFKFSHFESFLFQIVKIFIQYNWMNTVF